MELFNQNLIVAATNFNVTLITQVWLRDNGVVLDSEFTGPMLFTPGLVQLETELFRFLATPNQIQVEPKCSDDRTQQIFSERIGRFVSLLPHTPYVATGINFVWHYKPVDGRTIQQVSKQAFFRADAPFAHLFDSEDAKFGAYFSKDEFGIFRLRLTIGPIEMQFPDRPTMEERIQFAFNYHCESRTADRIIDAIGHWDEVRTESQRIVEVIEGAL